MLSYDVASLPVVRVISSHYGYVCVNWNICIYLCWNTLGNFTFMGVKPHGETDDLTEIVSKAL